MKAVLLTEYGGPDKLKYVEDLPEPQVNGDEVLIATAATSVNPIDWKIRSGAMAKMSALSFPAVLGRDVSGIVRAVGAKVSGVKPGDRVMALADHTYAELVAVKAGEVTHVPDGVDLVDAAAIPLVVLTGEQLIREACGVTEGQTVLISGATGSVGRAAVHTAKKLGVKVIAGVRRKSMDDARELGVTAVVALDDAAELAKVGLVDAVADTVGGETGSSLLAKVKQGGVFGTVTGPPPGAELNPQVRIVAMHAHPDPAKVREFADDVRDGKFILPIGRRMTLREAGEAQAIAEKGGVGKVLLLAM